MKDVDRRTVLLASSAATLGLAQQANAQDDDVAAHCASWIDAWVRKDLGAIGRHLHPEMEFVGPMARLRGSDAFVASTARILNVLERFEPRATFVAGSRAMLAYDFVCRPPIGNVPTAELAEFEGGRIRRIEIFYDARPFEAAQRAALPATGTAQ